MLRDDIPSRWDKIFASASGKILRGDISKRRVRVLGVGMYGVQYKICERQMSESWVLCGDGLTRVGFLPQ